MRIYFDNASTTPLCPHVLEEMMPLLTEHHGNPSSIHAEGRKVRMLVEKARKKVADYLTASTSEVFFTSSATEANNMILRGCVYDRGIERIISSQSEHHCVLHTLEFLEKNSTAEIEYLNLKECGSIDIGELDKMLADSSKKTLVSLMHANNEIGTMIDIGQVGEVCKKHGALFHSDTVQSVGKYPLNLQDLKVDFISGSGHKLYGPKGIGFLYMNADAAIKPLIHGGGQERNMRAGTENVYGIVGLAKALELAYDNLESRRDTISEIRQHFLDKVMSYNEDIQYVGNKNGHAHYGILNLSLPKNEKTEMIVLNLDISGVSTSAGSACTSGSEHDSHVMSAINHKNRKNVRFSFSHHNTIAEANIAAEKLISFLN